MKSGIEIEIEELKRQIKDDLNTYKEKCMLLQKDTKDYDYMILDNTVVQLGYLQDEVDRLGRANETKKELEYFKERNIRVIFLDIPTTQMDFSLIDDKMAKMILSCINDMLISFYDCIARSELERKKKRQSEGYEELRKRGEWDKLGRPRKMSKDDFEKSYQRVLDGTVTTTELMKELKLNKDTYFRYVREFKATHREDIKRKDE